MEGWEKIAEMCTLPINEEPHKLAQKSSSAIQLHHHLLSTRWHRSTGPSADVVTKVYLMCQWHSNLFNFSVQEHVYFNDAVAIMMFPKNDGEEIKIIKLLYPTISSFQLWARRRKLLEPVKSGGINIIFTFTVQKDQSVMVKCKQPPRQKQLHQLQLFAGLCTDSMLMHSQRLRLMLKLSACRLQPSSQSDLWQVTKIIYLYMFLQ